MPSDATTLLPDLRATVEQRLTEIDAIAAQRRAVLAPLAAFVSDRVDSERPSRLVFICTHNSRRSHMAQLWAQAAATVFSVSSVETFSGGTEATAFNPHAVAALRRAGFLIEPFTDGKNPIYEVSFAPGMAPMQVCSKAIDAPTNPTEGFAAVMTCSDADRACPTVSGAAARIVIPYDDPKASDGTAREAAAYEERCAEIAREMLWVFSQVARTT